MKDKRDTEEGGKEKEIYGIYFLTFVILLYIVLFIFEPVKIQKSLKVSGDLLIQIVPVLLLVIIFMGILNYFINPKTVSRHVGEGSGIKGWLLAIITGILSHGSIYVWYPLLKELRDLGMRNGLIAVFLYNRAIKIGTVLI